eukprot:CAMPEP_0172360172 /NCGR_PEP_ID=MMETSP1060-20121228/4249_1 /TAXON_ID=37318 /ORGANISM="Pseudo-nitzschia pungens, Strain cf. cingulata" /LENGTH=793 /DNA_ID=CAMNT_0013082091 /DNA_START=186 /DNA_END=2567 /DNA_ORIENTATION=+
MAKTMTTTMATTTTTPKTKSKTKTPMHFSGNERRAVFLSLLLCHFCHSYTAVSSFHAENARINSFSSTRSRAFASSSTHRVSRRRQRTSLSSLSSLSSLRENGNGAGPSLPDANHKHGMNRRQVFSNSAKAVFGGLATPFLLGNDPANALLLRFPVNDPSTQPLKNKYHFLRAGTSELELEGIYSTNPLFLTNRDNALSQQGYDCLKDAISSLKKTSLPPTVVYHSLAANGMDTGDYIARELRLGRDRLLPEFTYLDQRGIGLWDSSDETVVRPAVWAMDAMEAGAEGFGARPPANTDGTPNDTLHDQFTRLRQFLSLQESRTAGDIILIIFPDGTGPALLSCMIAGIPYREVHSLEYQPGELRMDITPESVRALYEERKNDPDYLAKIEEGKEKLKDLREMKAKDFSVSFKDGMANEKQELENQAFYEKQREEAAAKLKAEEERKAAMEEQLRLSRERAAAKEEQRRQEALAIQQKKEQKLRKQRELADKRKAEQQAAYDAKKQALKEKADAAAAAKAGGSSSSDASSMPFGLSPVVLGAAGVGIVGAAALLGGSGEEAESDSSTVLSKKNGGNGDDDGDDDDEQSALANATTAELSAIPAAEIETPTRANAHAPPVPVPSSLLDVHETSSTISVGANATSTDPTNESDSASKTTDASSQMGNLKEQLEGIPDSVDEPNLKDAEEEFTNKLQAAEQEMKDALVEAASVKEKKQQQQPKKQSSLFDNDPPVTITSTQRITKTTNFVYDDDEDDSDWLRVLGEIREEVEDEEEDEFGMVDYAALVNNNDDVDVF